MFPVHLHFLRLVLVLLLLLTGTSACGQTAAPAQRAATVDGPALLFFYTDP